MQTAYIVNCGLSGSTAVIHIISQTAQEFGKKLLNIKYLLFLFDFNETLIFSTDFKKRSNIKSYEKSVQWKMSCSMQMDRNT
jgi:hypothetical protein